MHATFSRAFFLRGAIGLGVAGWVAGPGRFGTAHGEAPAADWVKLRSQVQGRVITAGDADYGKAKQVFNTRFDDRTPAAVVQVANVDDVAAAVRFAAENDLVVAARAGGHSYVGASTANGALIVDVRRLTGIHCREGKAVVAAGMSMYGVYRELDRHQQTLPGGICPAIGVAGVTLGGGIGIESRCQGLTCDSLVAAQLVLPDGTVTEVSESQRPELLWALRGAGSSIGVVTSLTYRTQPATSKDIVRLTFSGADTTRAISGWSDYCRSADRAQWADLTVDADGHGGISCWIQLTGPAGTGPRATAAFTDATTKPLTSDCRTLTHMDTVTHLAGGHETQPRASFTCGSDIITELSADAIDAIVEAVTAHSAAGGTGWTHINTLDGALRDTRPGDTAFPWREHAALVEWGAYQPVPHEVAAAWIADAHQLIEFVSAGAYANYLEEGDSAQRYYSHNLPRLTTLRQLVDPDNRMYTGLAD
ncbi:FAD-binding oxidoreductase [Nocardia sp. JMUB6875]|uniref:FAD-dependent oxidoreductase n=1 Tax=Nocardia sp. JMUB6875 TaxID=3158170 RepID=UPI0032E60016